MSLIGLFGVLVLIALLVWAVPKLLAAISVPPNVSTVIYVGLVVLIVLWLLSLFGAMPSVRLR
jgi:hypothetical protein